jgi:lipopolysaccharide/colanic/teichoic acid biosynthesis glycosyltransferase
VFGGRQETLRRPEETAAEPRPDALEALASFQVDIRTGELYPLIKRTIDIVCSLLGLIVLSPLFLLFAALIPLESRGTPFYAHERIGLRGREFKLYKFRSMRSYDAPLTKLLSEEQLAQYHKEFKLDNDPRVTRIGRFIRKTSIDELPQLVNVLCGDMSLVGPRPVVVPELENYGNQVPLFLSVKPGLTGYWQAYARSNAIYETGQRQKMELHYVLHRSLLLDIKILFKTVFSVIRGHGAK